MEKMSRDGSLSRESLVIHVGCGSLDNYGKCPKCDEIRRILEGVDDTN